MKKAQSQPQKGGNIQVKETIIGGENNMKTMIEATEDLGDRKKMEDSILRMTADQQQPSNNIINITAIENNESAIAARKQKRNYEVMEIDQANIMVQQKNAPVDNLMEDFRAYERDELYRKTEDDGAEPFIHDGVTQIPQRVLRGGDIGVKANGQPRSSSTYVERESSFKQLKTQVVAKKKSRQHPLIRKSNQTVTENPSEIQILQNHNRIDNNGQVKISPSEFNPHTRNAVIISTGLTTKVPQTAQQNKGGATNVGLAQSQSMQVISELQKGYKSSFHDTKYQIQSSNPSQKNSKDNTPGLKMYKNSTQKKRDSKVSNPYDSKEDARNGINNYHSRGSSVQGVDETLLVDQSNQSLISINFEGHNTETQLRESDQKHEPMIISGDVQNFQTQKSSVTKNDVSFFDKQSKKAALSSKQESQNMETSGQVLTNVPELTGKSGAQHKGKVVPLKIDTGMGKSMNLGAIIAQAKLLKKNQEQAKKNEQQEQVEEIGNDTENDEIVQELKPKFSISQVRKNYTQFSKEKKQKYSVKQIQDLVDQNEQRYMGREKKFVTGFSQKQCVTNLDSDDIFFTVQHISTDQQVGQNQKTENNATKFIYYHLNPTLSDLDFNKTQSNMFKDKNKSAAQSQDSGRQMIRNSQSMLQDFGNVEPTDAQINLNPTKKNSGDLQGDYVSISMWQKPTDKEPAIKGAIKKREDYQCQKPLYMANVLSKLINTEKDLCQTLFVGRNKQVFFFNDNTAGYLTLNIIDLTPLSNPVDGQYLMEKKLIKFNISKQSKLNEQLRYQLLEHKRYKKNNYTFIDPTIDLIQDKLYLILTQIENGVNMPSICFYELDQEAGSDVYQVQSNPTFEIVGADFYLQTDANNNVFFIANKALINGKYLDPSYARLCCPTQVKRISIKELHSLMEENIQTEQKWLFFDKLLTWDLMSNEDALNVFRTNSHDDYAYVEAIFNQKMGELAMRFSGSEATSSCALSFALIPVQNGKKKAKQDPTTLVSGFYINERGEEVELNLPIFKDVNNSQPIQGKEFSKRVNKIFEMDIEYQDTDWTPHAEVSYNYKEFQIFKWEFDQDSGQFTGGKGLLDKEIIELRPMPKDQDDMRPDSNFNFQNEINFTMELFAQNAPDLKARFEGYCHLSTLSSHIIGEIINETDSQNIVRHKLSFNRVNHAQLRLNYNPGNGQNKKGEVLTTESEQADDSKEFNVKIVNGQIFSVVKTQQMTLNSQDQVSYSLVKNAHRLFQNSQGIFALSGSLNLLYKKILILTNQKDIILDLANISPTLKDHDDKQSLKFVPAWNIITKLRMYEEFKNEDGIIQEILMEEQQTGAPAIGIPEYNANIAAIGYVKLDGPSSINFFTEKIIKPATDDDDDSDDEQDSSNIQRPILQTQISDYPLIAYKNFNSDDSEIVITNVAQKGDTQSVVNLGQWKFLSFIGTPKPMDLFGSKMNPLMSYIFVLAKHRETKKLRIIAIENDPWTGKENDEQNFQALVLTTTDFILPEEMSLDELRKVECLVGKDTIDKMNVVLLLQFERVIYAISLTKLPQDSDQTATTQEDLICNIFDQRDEKMLPRLMVRNQSDAGHVYIAVEQSNSHKIMRIELNPENPGKVELKDYYVLLSSLVLSLEFDPEKQGQIYVLDDQLAILSIYEDIDGKGIEKQKTQLQPQTFDEELKVQMIKPWTSVCITERVVKTYGYYLSVTKNFYWKDSHGNLTLISEKIIPGALYLLQILMGADNRYVFRLKPLPGCHYLDLVGQSRANEDLHMYFANDENIMVSFAGHRPIIFNSMAQIIDQKHFNPDKKSWTIFNTSVNSKQYGKFFLMKDTDGIMSLIKYDQTDGFKDQSKPINIQKLQDQVSQLDFNEPLSGRIKGKNQQIIREIRVLPTNFNQNDVKPNTLYLKEREIEESFMIHSGQTFVAKNGTVIMIASAILDNDKIDMSQTIFDYPQPKDADGNIQEDVEQDSTGADGGNRRASMLDNYSYEHSQKLVGFYKFEQVMLVIFLCKTQEQQIQFGPSISIETKGNSSGISKLQSLINKSLGSVAQLSAQYLSNISIDQDGDRASLMNKSVLDSATPLKLTGKKDPNSKKNLTFNTIGNKMTWFDFDHKTVWHFEMKDFYKIKQGKLHWTQINCNGFTIKEMLEGLTRKKYIKKGIQLTELDENSVLRYKKIQEVHDRDMCFLQIMSDNHSIVYNLQPENRYEVALLHRLDVFVNPLKFSITGFEIDSPSRTMLVNKTRSLGLGTKIQSSNKISVVLPFTEIDLKQIKFISDKIAKNNSLTKIELRQIEPISTICEYNGETFFSLFQEQTIVYECVHDLLSDLENNDDADGEAQQIKDKKNATAHYIRLLQYILEKPVPVRVEEDEYLTNMSMLKQCLLFTNNNATVMLYKLAKLVPHIDFEDYISSQQDIQIILERLPAQQYINIFNRFGENHHTKKVTEANLHINQDGDVQNLMTFVQSSAVISQHTKQLGLQRLQSDNEVRKKVQIQVLPLNWIYNDPVKGNISELFNFFRNNLDKLRSQLLVDVIFQSFWKEQQRLILWYCFLPYVVYFLFSQVYYLSFMSQNVVQELDENDLVFECSALSIGMQCNHWIVWEEITRYTLLLLTIHQTWIEFFQAFWTGLGKYLSQRSNLLDLTTLILNLTLIILICLKNYIDLEMYWIRVIASMASVMLWFQLFFWLRLFDFTAQYIDLITTTLRDISKFVVVLFIVVVSFTTGFYILQINRVVNDYNGLEDPLFPYDEETNIFYESFMFQYKLLLGDFENISFKRSYTGLQDSMASAVMFENLLISVYFIATTFFTQITILNMLIAIMSETYQKHSQGLSELGKRQKLKLMAEYLMIVDIYTKYIQKCKKCCSNTQASSGNDRSTEYLFIVQPYVNTEEVDNDDNSEAAKQMGQFFKLKSSMDIRFKALSKQITRQAILKDIKSVSTETRTRLQTLEKDQKMRTNAMGIQIRDLAKKQKEMDDDNRDEQARMQKEMQDQIEKVEGKMLKEIRKVLTILKPIDTMKPK